MRHRTLTLWLAAVLLVPCASALAGSHWRGAMHNGKFWKKSEVRKALQLTDDEVHSLDRIFAREQNNLKALKADVEKRRDDLDALLVADEVGEQQVLGQVDLLEQARARLGFVRFSPKCAIDGADAGDANADPAERGDEYERPQPGEPGD